MKQAPPVAPSITRLTEGEAAAGAIQPPEAVQRRIRARLGTGHALLGPLRRFMETRFGADLGRVRLHTDTEAQQLNHRLGMRAFSVGPSIFVDAGRYQPDSLAGRQLLAHELVHAVQQENLAGRAGGAVRVMGQSTDVAARARYPTAAERRDILDILNPQQEAAARGGGNVPPVTDPAGFASDMRARLNEYIDAALPAATARQASTVSLDEPAIDALGDIAQPAVEAFYGAYLTAAVHSPAEQRRRAGYRLREHLHLVPTAASAQTDRVARNWVASRMRAQGADILEGYHVLSGDNARDEALFVRVRDEILAQRRADVITIVLFHPGYESGGEAYIQPRLAPGASGETAQVTLRRGRWASLGTIIHEMLHAVAHERFAEAAAPLEESGVAVEGFAEYFTRPVYNRMVERAETDNTFRAGVEGRTEPFDRSLAPERRQYQRYVDAVERIRNLVGGNEDNLKVAYFMGRVEYLGLGGWNESEAARRRFPGNTLGFAAMVTGTGGGFFRIDYGRVILGRGGDFQFQLGGTINYLTEGERLGVGGTAALQYSGRDVYVRGGVGVGASAAPTQPFADSVRLDLIPGAEAGVRIGIVRIGAGVNLLIPVAGGPISERVIKLGAGVGLSFAL